MITISLCMIVKNEASRLSNCLETIKDIVDEIIIVDTGSTDDTVEIAKKYTDKIFYFEWVNDFSKARNYSFSLATKDYIMWLDADDILLEENRQKLIKLKESIDKKVNCVKMVYDYSFDENGKITCQFSVNKLVKNNMGFYWDSAIHETLNAWGKIIESDIHITHTRTHYDAQRNVDTLRRKMQEGSSLSTRETLLYGQELYFSANYDDAIRVLEDVFRRNDLDLNTKRYYFNIIAICYEAKNDFKNALSYYIDSLKDIVPEVNTIYKLARLYHSNKKYDEAIFWYKVLVEIDFSDFENHEIDKDYITFFPYIQLSMCYYYGKGNCEKANKYNEKAAQYKPEDKNVLLNREFYKSILCDNKEA
jgi:glycosyltransferase involved in cell wall biosynthesis